MNFKRIYSYLENMWKFWEWYYIVLVIYYCYCCGMSFVILSLKGEWGEEIEFGRLCLEVVLSVILLFGNVIVWLRYLRMDYGLIVLIVILFLFLKLLNFELKCF